MLDINNLYCTQCGEKLVVEIRGTNAVRSSSPRYDNHGKVLPICRKCAIAQFEIYVKRYDRIKGLANKKMALLRFCESYDFPFISRFIPKAESSEFLFDYLRKLWAFVNVSKKSYTFDDSDIKTEKELLTKIQLKAYFGQFEDKEQDKEKKSHKEEANLRAKWGNNKEWDSSDYEFLESKYEKLIPEGGEKDPQVIEAIETACLYSLIERQKIMEGDTSGAKSARDALDKVLASAQLRASDQKNQKEALIQDIVTIMDSEEMVEPWDYIVHYDCSLDLVEQVALILVNDARKMMGAEPYSSLAQGGYKLEDKLGQCLKEPSAWEKEVKEQLSIYSENDDYKNERSEKDEEIEKNKNGE